MTELNYKSDFELIITFVENDNEIPVPDFDFKLIFKTDGYSRYIAERYCGELRNCLVENGKLRVQFKNHGLELGRLRSEYYLYVINGNFSDGIQRVVSTSISEITLIDGIGDEMREVNINWIMPTVDYSTLRNKPQINGVTLDGDKTPGELRMDIEYVRTEDINNA